MINGKPLIAGIQQVGLGNACVYSTWQWYRENLGFDIPVFNEAAVASLMQRYTGGRPWKRHAILALNLHGGGGLEIWQFTERTPQAPAFMPTLGDLGIFILKVKSPDVPAAFKFLKEKGVQLLSEVSTNPAGQQHFYLSDPFGNHVEVVQGNSWFSKRKKVLGGVYGCVIGVSCIEHSLPFYRNILKSDICIFDEKKAFEDFKGLPGGEQTFRRVLLRHSEPVRGPFARLLGDYEIELVEVQNHIPRKIFENRFWGDLGYIHLCFDITGMEAMRNRCEQWGYPFRVDSANSFDMGEAAGHFSYVEDPDGTLIEFVETHRLPLLKKLGWYLDLRKRKPGKELPNWMLKAMQFNRVK